MGKAEWFAEEELTHSIIGAFYRTYNVLGPGFMESVYLAALTRVLEQRGHRVATEVRVPVHFQGEIIAYQRIDMIVDDKVIVELKATQALHKDAPRQLLGYLKATRLEVGLLLHFSSEARFYRLANRNHQ